MTEQAPEGRDLEQAEDRAEEVEWVEIVPDQDPAETAYAHLAVTKHRISRVFPVIAFSVQSAVHQ